MGKGGACPWSSLPRTPPLPRRLYTPAGAGWKSTCVCWWTLSTRRRRRGSCAATRLAWAGTAGGGGRDRPRERPAAGLALGQHTVDHALVGVEQQASPQSPWLGLRLYERPNRGTFFCLSATAHCPCLRSLYDCDFNQQLGLGLTQPARRTVFDLDSVDDLTGGRACPLHAAPCCALLRARDQQLKVRAQLRSLSRCCALSTTPQPPTPCRRCHCRGQSLLWLHRRRWQWLPGLHQLNWVTPLDMCGTPGAVLLLFDVQACNTFKLPSNSHLPFKLPLAAGANPLTACTQCRVCAA